MYYIDAAECPMHPFYCCCRFVEQNYRKSRFNYLGNTISCEGELDNDNKLNNFLKITGILSNVFRPEKKLL